MPALKICSALWDGIPRRLPGSPNIRSVFPPFRFLPDKWLAEVSIMFGKPVRIERCAFFCLEKTNICAILKEAEKRGALRGEGVRFFGVPDHISHGGGINVAKSARIAYNK